VELKEGGATIPVTQDNKREFVQLSAQYRLYSSIKDQINALLGGFYEIIPKELISIVRMHPDALDLLLICEFPSSTNKRLSCLSLGLRTSTSMNGELQQTTTVTHKRTQ
jgi:HECT-domain (ubiquitin-transferase)